jgi:beta-glucosidase
MGKRLQRPAVAAGRPAPASLSRVVLSWDTAYGQAYEIQVSDDAASWTTIYSTTTGTGGVEDLAVSGTGYGYSLWEFQVYGVQL